MPALAADCRQSTEAENVEVARKFHEAVINQRNPAVLDEILAAGLVHHAAGPYPEELNADEVKAMMAGFLTAFPDLQIRFDDFIVDEDRVVERYTATGTQKGDLPDLPASGRSATWTGVNIFGIECGRIIEIWSEVDAAGRERQLRED
ncbi:MAG: ester cyclase [Geminicoccaceae bacterium]